jgi:hypothetical protein
MSSGSCPSEIVVIPEDDATRNIANGFEQFEHVQARKIKVLSKSKIGKGGWQKVVDWFAETQIAGMRKNENRIVVFIIDFDGREGNLNHREYVNRTIPDDLKNRVFTLGAWDEAEKLKTLGSYEAIGKGLAQDCYDNTDIFWKHDQLKHNQDELKRMHSIVNFIMFG